MNGLRSAVVIILVSAAVGLTVDYVHVLLMPVPMQYPTPMALVFTTSMIVALVAITTSLRKGSSQGFMDAEAIAALLPDVEKRVIEYLYKKGGEARQAEISKALGLNKVRTWRVVRRLRDKGLVIVRKEAGRVVVSLSPRLRTASRQA